MAPAGLDGFFRDTCNPPGVPPKQLTREQIREIALKYGTEFRIVTPQYCETWTSAGLTNVDLSCSGERPGPAIAFPRTGMIVSLGAVLSDPHRSFSQPANQNNPLGAELFVSHPDRT